MNRHGGLAVVFLLLLLLIIVVLQIHSIVQSDKFYAHLNRLDKIIESIAAVDLSRDERDVTGGLGEAGAGDEGDRLVWASRVEPKTLNPVSAEADIYARWIKIPYIFFRKGLAGRFRDRFVLRTLKMIPASHHGFMIWNVPSSCWMKLERMILKHQNTVTGGFL